MNDSLQKTRKCEFWAESAGFGEKIKKFPAKFPEAGKSHLFETREELLILPKAWVIDPALERA